MAAINDTSFIIIGGRLRDNSLIGGNLAQIYNLETGIWTRMQDMEPGRYMPKCLNFMDGVMVAGGDIPTWKTLEFPGIVSKDVNFFNLTTNMWQKLPSMNYARNNHILAQVNGIPTVIGVFNLGQGGVFNNNAEQFINGRWSNWIEQPPAIWHSFVQVPKDDFHC